MYLYNEHQSVKQTLRSQLIEAIPAEYLDVLRNLDTDMVNDHIIDIIAYLQINYGRVTDQELSDKEDQLKNTYCDPNTPVDAVFNKVNIFQDLCILYQTTTHIVS